MRTIILCIVMAVSVNLVSAQVVNIPDKAKTHFASKYPGVKDAKWTNNVSNYTAEFPLKGVPAKATYNIDGSWSHTEVFIPDSKVPKSVKDSFAKSKYKDWEVKSMVGIETSKGEKGFRVEATKGIEKKYIFYDKNGVTLKESTGI